MLILDSGILLALSLSCGWNFKVWAVELPCTRVKAKTGDKALMSWWAVKLGRNQLWPMIYKFVWFIWLQMLLRLLCYFGCYVTLVASCIYVQLWIWSVSSYYVICNNLIFKIFWFGTLEKKVHVGDIRLKACCLLIKPTLVVEYGNNGSILRWESTWPKKRQNHTGGLRAPCQKRYG